MKIKLEVSPFIHTVGVETIRRELYLKSFDVKHIGNIKGLIPIMGIDFNETEIAYAKRLKTWKQSENDVLFDGWIIKDMKHWTHIENYSRTISMMFEFKSYTIINVKEYKFPHLPQTIDDFITDCNRIGVKLFWKQEIIDKFGVADLTSVFM